MGSGVFCMPFDSFANNVFLAKGNEQQVDFFIHGYTKFKFFGSDVYLTTTHISMIIVIAALLIFAVFANRAIRKATPDQVPGPFLNVVELIVESLDGMVAGSMGESKAPKFRNYVSALFLFILACNLSGLLGFDRRQQITVSHFRWRSLLG
ncbi:F0F1 ATP synthase subunit A [Clostridium sp. AM49-4BH]|uniref:F0F1 ATP synthase subunit A n=1 Tax=Clostridium sp. AM49-4BH TaxID=2293035 RepID=UPI00325B2D6B